MKIRKKILGLVLAIVLILPVLSQIGGNVLATDEVDVWDGTIAAGFESGTGTEADPYIIKTPEQLAYLASTTNNQAETNTYNNKYIKLANDIYLNDTTNWENWGTAAPKNQWEPIATALGGFQGIFDGNSCTIYGMYINRDNMYSGLFSWVNGGTIKNTSIEKSFIHGSKEIGGICGCVSNGVIINCNNAGIIMSCSDGGGVCGYAGDSVISNCYNTGNIVGYYGYHWYGIEIGGICGYAYDTNISNCYNFGNVSANGSEAGGICGYIKNNCVISNCYNAGAVNVGGTHAGGVCGYIKYVNSNSCIVSNCYNVGSVSGNGGVGGVCGYYYKDIITNCYYLLECAKDSNDKAQNGIGNETNGKTTADVSGSTTGLTDAQMKQQSSFVGFDFNQIWIIGLTGYDYPALAWQKKDIGNTHEETIHKEITTDSPDVTTTPASTEKAADEQKDVTETIKEETIHKEITTDSPDVTATPASTEKAADEQKDVIETIKEETTYGETTADYPAVSTSPVSTEKAEGKDDAENSKLVVIIITVVVIIIGICIGKSIKKK